MRFRRFAIPIACPEKKRIIITRIATKLQATIKDSNLDLLTLKDRSTNVDQLMISKISLLEQIR